MITPELVLDALVGLSGWIALAVSSNSAKKADHRSAAEAVLVAVDRTRAYLSDHSDLNGANPELSELWYRASVKLRPFDKDLARRCQLKGGYWTRPADWSTVQIDAAQIQIDQITAEASLLAKD